MSNFIKVAEIDVTPLRLQLSQQPQLWNQHADRTTRPSTAHDQTSDIWLRYRPIEQLTGPLNFNEPFHDMEWYPAYYVLPEIRPITQFLMQRVSGTALGGCLITRIPAGKRVKRHTDQAVWHARFYQTKIYIPLQSNSGCINISMDEQLIMQQGECWYFDNCKEHEVLNNGDAERITLIVSIRTQ